MSAMMTTTHPAGLLTHHVPLAAGPAAVPEARARVRAVVRAWRVPVDPYPVALLTSELVTNAIRHEATGTISLEIQYSARQLRVDVHDTSCAAPAPGTPPADAETGRGLIIVAALADEWGFYATPAGKAVYFTLALQPRGSAT